MKIIACWDIGDDSISEFYILVHKGKILLSILMALSCVYILVCVGKILWSLLMPRVLCVHFGQLVDHCVM
jgi:hypothetical protein